MSDLFQRSLGLELSGPRSDKSVLTSLDYYPSQKRAVLSEILVFNDRNIEPDIALIEGVSQCCNISNPPTGMAINAPLSFPPYLNEEAGKKLPKIKHSKNAEAQWMYEQYLKLEKKGRAPRPVVPYLQRPAEFYLRSLSPERFPIADAFSANSASLAARMRFLGPYFPTPLNEVYNRGAVNRLCQSLEMPKFVERGYSSLTNGLESRHEFFVHIQKKLPKLFMYEEHIESMTLHLWVFHAFIGAFTQFLLSQKLCDAPPRDFPTSSPWIHLPKAVIDWEKLL